MVTKVAAQAKLGSTHSAAGRTSAWDQLLLVLGCAGGACGSVDLQLLDLT